ncbi:MAG TPA: PilZ domain-containing protein [Candidatus Obscuribacterales bacterium]
MFRRGKVLKVKVELSADVVGFGRATVVESEGSRLFLNLRTSKGEKRNLPKGTRIWFVSDSPDNPFNGLWSTTILSSRVIEGKTALECTRPKFEAQLQRRKFKRVSISYPVHVHGERYDNLQISTRNVSKTGVGLEMFDDHIDLFKLGHNIDLTLDSAAGPIHAKGRIVQSRFNWLANKSDIGVEFIGLDEQTGSLLDKLLQSVAGESLGAPAGKEGGGHNGQLSTWLKSTRDNVNFVKIAADKGISAEDIEELESDDGDDIDDDHVSD